MDTQTLTEGVRARMRRRGLRTTKARERLLVALAEAPQPLSADELHDLAGESMDRTTVYRTLESFEAADIIRRVDLQRGGAQRYELSGDHHHHITCTHCGRIKVFRVCGVERIIRQALAEVPDFSIEHHSLELFGLCSSCSQRRSGA